MEKIKFTRSLFKVGGSLVTPIPVELLDYLDANEGDTIVLCADNGKHGKFVSFWIKEE